MTQDDQINKVEDDLRASVQAKWSLLDKVTNDAIENDKKNLAAQLGVFLVYIQKLEDQLKSLLTIIYSFKSYTKGDELYIYTSVDKLKWDDLPLGGVVDKLRSVAIKETSTKVDILKPVLDKISNFKGTRNGYIHKLLNDKNLSNLELLRLDIIKANKELLEISSELSEVTERARNLYGIDDSFKSITEHVVFKDS